MNFNAARLIKLVKERPCIYDVKYCKMPKHQRESMRDKKFAEIAAILNLNTQIVKMKWKNLRDTYIKYLKWEMKHPNKSKSWVWSRHMKFMKTHLLSIQSQLENGRDSQATEDEEDDRSESSHSEPEYKDVEFLELSREGSPVPGQDPEVDSPKIQGFSYPGQEEVSITNSQGPYSYLENQPIYEALELIFLGYAKTIKTFSTRRQAQVKLKIAKLIIEEELAHYDEENSRNQKVIS